MLKLLKPYLLLFAGMLLLGSCKQPGKKTTASVIDSGKLSNTTTTLQYNNPLFKDYRSFLDKLDSTNMENSVVAAKKYVEIFGKQSQPICDSAFTLFNAYYRRLSNRLEDLPSRDSAVKYDSLLTDSNGKYLSKLSGPLKVYAEKLRENGFKVSQSEGDNYVGQDLDFVAKWFYQYVSPVMKQYLGQLNQEEKEGFSEDAELIIGATQFVDRTVWWEKFAAQHAGQIMSTEAQNNWKGYLETLLDGMDNSPVTNDDHVTVVDYFKTVYSYLQSKYPDTQTNKFVSPYFKLLTQKDAGGAKKLLEKYKKDGVIQ